MTKGELMLHNRFDNYEISAMFASSSEEYLQKHFLPVRRRFLYKCILGPLLALNAYLSHWGPWKWPNTYWFFVFSVIFYYIGSYAFEYITSFDEEGVFIGEYCIDGKNTIATIAVSKDKKCYTFQLRNPSNKRVIVSKSFAYDKYFTVSGVFLEAAFLKEIATFLKIKKQ